MTDCPKDGSPSRGLGSLVSIGLPVRNGGQHLRQAVASLLNQTYRHLELIISDNASTDDTELICGELAAADSRIRYFRQPTDIGMPANWNFVVHQARGAYFKWASSNDWCDLTLVERCLVALQADPTAVLSFPRTLVVGSGGEVGPPSYRDFACVLPSPSERFQLILHHLVMNNAQCGVIRMAALRQTRLDRLYPDGDRVFMAELALIGRFLLIDEPLFYRRVSAGSAMFLVPPDQHMALFMPGRVAPLRWRRWLWAADVLLTAAAARVPFTERIKCLRVAAREAWSSRAYLMGEFRRAIAAAGD